MYTVVVRTSAKKDLRKIPKTFRHRLDTAIQSLSMDPYSGKQLEGEYEGQYSLRVWPYRILYIIQKNIVTVVILSIGHRQGVYK